MAGNLRVTQEYVSLLGEGPSDLRVTQLYVSILGPSEVGTEFQVSASSSIGVSQTARSATLDLAASNALSLSIDTDAAGPIYEAASNSISLTQVAVSSIKSLSASNSIGLTQAAGSSIKMAAASSSISLGQAAASSILMLSAPSAISLGQESSPGFHTLRVIVTPLTLASAAGSNEIGTAVSNALALSQSAQVINRPLHKSASSAISLASSSTGEGPFKPVASNTLAIAQSTKHNLIFVSAVNGLTLFDETRLADTYEVSASASLPLSQAATGFSGRVSADSSLALGQIGDTDTKTRSTSNALAMSTTASVEVATKVSNALSLTQAAVQGLLNLTASSELAISQIGRIINITLVIEENILNLTQTVETNIKMLSAADTIGIDHSLNVLKPIRVSATSELITVEEVFDVNIGDFVEVESGLNQTAIAALGGPRALGHILSFSQVASAVLARADGTAASASNTVVLSDEGRLSIPRATEPSRLNLTQAATGIASDVAKSELSTLDVAASALIVRGITSANSLVVKQAVAYVFEKDTTKCFYTPFIGDSSDPDAPAPPPATYTAAGGTEGVRLQYPADGSVTDELILKGPNLGNRDRLAMSRINRETRGGTLVVFADPDWPKVETLLMSFSGLTRTEAQDLLTFMESHLGEEIRFIDWENRLWRGALVEVQDPIVQDGRSDCSFTGSFAFEGEKV